MLDFAINSVNILEIETGSCDILGTEFTAILKEIFMIIQIAVPCLVIALCTVDISKAVISQNDQARSSALSSTIKRVCIGVAIFFVPVLLNFLLKLAGFAIGTCDISDWRS